MPSGILIHAPVCEPQYMGQNWECCAPPPFGGIKEGRGPHLTQYVAWTEVYVRTKRHLNPSSRFATMGGGAVPL